MNEFAAINEELGVEKLCSTIDEFVRNYPWYMSNFEQRFGLVKLSELQDLLKSRNTNMLECLERFLKTNSHLNDGFKKFIVYLINEANNIRNIPDLQEIVVLR